MMKRILLCFSLLCASILSAHAQTTCNPNGNLVLFTNYDGGVLNINVDVNIPNLRIGICSYEAITINLSGTYVNNVVAVKYAGYNSSPSTHCVPSPGISTTTINGAPGSATTSITFAPTANVSNTNGYGSIICAYSCSNTTNQGGCNTVDQVEGYFLNQFSGSILRMHKVQYGCWTGTQTISGGGNCCPSVVPPTPLSFSTNVVMPTCYGGCNGSITVSASGGTPPYMYKIGANPPQTSPVFNGLCIGTYSITVTDAASGTSTQMVTVNQPAQKTSTLTQTACKQYNFLSTILTTTGTYKDTIPAGNGCDSIITLNLTINNANVNVTQNGSMLTAQATGATYQWLNCDSNKKVINGATAQSYTPPKSGNYAVKVTQNGCTDTSACKSVTLAGIESQQQSETKFYPNPVQEELIIETVKNGGDYVLTNLEGRVVLQGKLRSGKNVISLRALPVGSYFLRAAGINDKVKLVKQ